MKIKVKMIYLSQKEKKKNYWEDCRINLVKPRKNYAK